jgi:hypothetical protein
MELVLMLVQLGGLVYLGWSACFSIAPEKEPFPPQEPPLH